MSAPMPFRKFEQLVKSGGCYIDKTTKEWCVRTMTGGFLMSFAVKHGKEEVKDAYVKKFKKKMGLK